MSVLIPCPFCDDRRFGSSSAVGLDMGLTEHVERDHGKFLPQAVRDQIYDEWPPEERS